MVRVVPLAERHRADWERLYAGYAGFYKTTQTPEMRARVWAWIRALPAIALGEAPRA